MNRRRLSIFVRWLLRLHYAIQIEGKELMLDNKVHLLLPNHPAFIEPPMLFAECYDSRMRPMADEAYFHKPLAGYALRLTNAIVVPDLPATSASQREQQAAIARNLTNTAVQTLRQGNDLVFYPSGHIKRSELEQIGNRRLAYEVCSELLANGERPIRVIMLRTTGLDHSYTSRLKWHPALRRHVTMHFEDMTEQIAEWTRLDRRAFNEQLEHWYNNNFGTQFAKG